MYFCVEFTNKEKHCTKRGCYGCFRMNEYILEVPVSVTLRALLAKLSKCLETVILSA